MLSERYARDLTFLLDPKYLGNYFSAVSKQTLRNQIEALRDQRKKDKWHFVINKAQPLTFIENEDKLQADISCQISGTRDDTQEVRTLLRIWSSDPTLCYRTGIDATQVGNQFRQTGKRVLIRIHFEPRRPTARIPEPTHHFQIGGVPDVSEICWWPKQIDVPRLYYPPMDVILLSELVLVNLFPRRSSNLRKKPEWTALIRKSQNYFQQTFCSNYYSFFSSEQDTVLGNFLL